MKKEARGAVNDVKDFGKDVGQGIYSTGEEAYDGIHDAIYGGPQLGDTSGISATDPNAYLGVGATEAGYTGPPKESTGGKIAHTIWDIAEFLHDTSDPGEVPEAKSNTKSE